MHKAAERKDQKEAKNSMIERIAKSVNELVDWKKDGMNVDWIYEINEWMIPGRLNDLSECE